MTFADLIRTIGFGAFAAATVAAGLMIFRIEILVQRHDAPQSSPDFLHWKTGCHPFRGFALLYSNGIATIGDRWVTILAWIARIALPLGLLGLLVQMLSRG